MTKKFHGTNTEGKSSGDRKRSSKIERMANSESTEKFAESSMEMRKHRRPGKRERELTKKEEIDSLKDKKDNSRFSSEKKELDNRFSYIASAINTAFNTFKGKHTRFISSDEGTETS